MMREVRQHFDILRRKLCRREKEVTGHLKSLTSGKVVVLHKQCRYVLLNFELKTHQIAGTAFKWNGTLNLNLYPTYVMPTYKQIFFNFMTMLFCKLQIGCIPLQLFFQTLTSLWKLPVFCLG